MAQEEETGGLHSEKTSPVDPKSIPFYKKRKWILLIALCAFIALLIVILVPIGVVVVGKKHNKSDSSSTVSRTSGSTSSGPSSTSSSAGTQSSTAIPAAASGTILDPSTWLDKTDFNTTYTNETVGGLPIMGLNSTWDDSKSPNSDAPPINESFDYGVRAMHGVNLGGWLILEPFITPSFFNSSDYSIVDEYTLSLQYNKTGGIAALKQAIETHYATWVTEKTFQEIADAGLDHVRIPYPYWAVTSYPGDPYLPKVAWRYLLRGIEWARKYGLRVNLDLHSVPGGQNGWNHSGRQGTVFWLNGTSEGYVYGNQTLALHTQLAKFFAQDRYKNIIVQYGLVNEPDMQVLNTAIVVEWTKQAYNVTRSAGFNNTIVFGDGFLGFGAWHGVFPEAQYPNLALDLHQYTIFDKNLLAMSHSAKLGYVCESWTGMITASSNTTTGHGLTLVGEWSQADNDCLTYLNNVGVGARWDGTYNATDASLRVLTDTCAAQSGCSCNVSNGDPSYYSDVYKQFLLQFAEGQKQAFSAGGGLGSMYWTWDCETENAVQWSYKKGMALGILPDKAYNTVYNCSSGISSFSDLPETI